MFFRESLGQKRVCVILACGKVWWLQGLASASPESPAAHHEVKHVQRLVVTELPAERSRGRWTGLTWKGASWHPDREEHDSRAQRCACVWCREPWASCPSCCAMKATRQAFSQSSECRHQPRCPQPKGIWAAPMEPPSQGGQERTLNGDTHQEAEETWGGPFVSSQSLLEDQGRERVVHVPCRFRSWGAG